VKRNGNPFGPLFLEIFRMMVSSGLAGARVQPCPRIKFELLATKLLASWLLAESAMISLEARSQSLVARESMIVDDMIEGSGELQGRACSSGG
jgi:hypothetical protein